MKIKLSSVIATIIILAVIAAVAILRIELIEKPHAETETCTVSVYCGEILSAMETLDPEKAELVPRDGYILTEKNVDFTAGESVFDVLKRTLAEQEIHFEYTASPIYDTAYIEGIGNIYEGDCGGTSGWIYTVNGESPDLGCSQYKLEDGDVVCWIYSIS